MTTKGIWIVIGVILAASVGFLLLGMHLGLIEGTSLNAIFVDPINEALPWWLPLDVPDLFG